MSESAHTHAHGAPCRDLLAQIGDYIDGELDPGLCQELERHMAGCVNCRLVLDTTRMTVSLFREDYDTLEELPPGAMERLRAALDRAGCH